MEARMGILNRSTPAGDARPVIAGQTSSRREAFTLIELLVVIAIIAILAAILFPVFAAARERGRQSACLAHQNELGKAMMMYVDDHKGFFPRGYYTVQEPRPGSVILLSVPGRTPWGYVYWGLEKYCSSSWKILICPSDPLTFNPGFGGSASYAYNSWYLGNMTPDWQVRGPQIRDAQIANPAQTVMIIETQPHPVQYQGQWIRTDHAYPPSISKGQYPGYGGIPKGYDSFTASRHRKGLNVTWADGHASWMPKYGELSKDDTLWDLE